MSAATLFERAESAGLIRVRRRTHQTIDVDGDEVVIRDQAPLHPGNIELAGGWSFEDIVAALNSFVFFWPGGAAGPNDYGVRHFARYADEDIGIIRCPLLDVVAANADRELHVCKYNSGSPRCVGGRRSPRGPNTFQSISQSTLRASEVVEVTFRDEIALPPTSVMSASLLGPWMSL